MLLIEFFLSKKTSKLAFEIFTGPSNATGTTS